MAGFRPIVAGATSFAIALSMAALSIAVMPFVTPARAADAVVDADALVVKPAANGAVVAEPAAAGGTALRLTKNATATTTLALPAASGVVIRAKGTQCWGAPVMTLSVDGKAVKTTTVAATSWADHPVAVTIPAGSHTLGIGFGNDFFLTAGCDRDLLLDRIVVVDNGTGSPPAPATSASGSFRTPIPAGAAVDADSAAMVARMSRAGAMYANLVEFGVPIYTATTSSPRYTVTCRITTWGPCPFTGMQVPIPDGAVASPGSDGAMVVVDQDAQKSYEFWQATRSSGKWSTSWGAVNSLGGSGWGGNSTGSGASRLGGVIRIAEIAAGTIPHALAIQTDNTCAGVFRAPATKTDGTSTRADCIPEGARVRLDPAVDVDRLTLAPAVRAVARALQVYGAYVVDTGGSPLSVSFEMDPAATATSIGGVYQQAGLRWDYDDLPGIPYERLQVLAS